MSFNTRKCHHQYNLHLLATLILLASHLTLAIANNGIGKITHVQRRIQFSQQQQRLVYDDHEDTAKAEYPTHLRYTEQHVWFGPDTNHSLTRVGLTSYPLTTPSLLNGSIDGGAVYLSRQDSFAANEIIARFVYSPDWDDPSRDQNFAVHAPYAGIWHAPNLDLDLDGMVKKPYSDIGFVGLVEGEAPMGEKGRDGVRFLDSREYAEFVTGLGEVG